MNTHNRKFAFLAVLAVLAVLVLVSGSVRSPFSEIPLFECHQVFNGVTYDGVAVLALHGDEPRPTCYAVYDDPRRELKAEDISVPDGYIIWDERFPEFRGTRGN
jgi:hypothetical protein